MQDKLQIQRSITAPFYIKVQAYLSEIFNIYKYTLKLFLCIFSIDTHNVIHGWGSDQMFLGSSPLIPRIKNKIPHIFAKLAKKLLKLKQQKQKNTLQKVNPLLKLLFRDPNMCLTPLMGLKGRQRRQKCCIHIKISKVIF